jgi:hypothetical protein
MPKFKTKTLIISLIFAILAAWLGLWWLAVVILAWTLIKRATGAILRSIGIVLRSIKDVSDGKGPGFEYLFHKKF